MWSFGTTHPYSQQDGQEFLRLILDALHQDLNRIPKSQIPKYTYTDEDVSKLSSLGKAALSWNRFKSTSDSVISDVFSGQLESIIECTTCGEQSATYDTIYDLSVPIPSSLRDNSKSKSSIHLMDCLNDFAKKETLDGAEWKCPKCKCKREATKQVLISKIPEILVIRKCFLAYIQLAI